MDGAELAALDIMQAAAVFAIQSRLVNRLAFIV